jgi:hypothetical protein
LKKIYLIRDQKVLLDVDLAALYAVETCVLKQAIKRNKERFPEDFMFVLNTKEFKNLRSQFVTSSWGGTRYPPMAFTEQGVAMLSSVLNSSRAIAVNIQIMRVFVRMRQMIISYKELLKKIEKLEASDIEQNEQIRKIYNLIRELLEPSVKNPKPIGFRIPKGKP